jgi:hypothetical protein
MTKNMLMTSLLCQEMSYALVQICLFRQRKQTREGIKFLLKDQST